MSRRPHREARPIRSFWNHAAFYLCLVTQCWNGNTFAQTSLDSRAVLQQTPESATVSVALASPRKLDNALAAISSAFPSLGAMSQGAFGRLGDWLRVPGIANATQAAEAIGVSADSAFGIYMDFSPVALLASAVLGDATGKDTQPNLPPLAQRWARLGVPPLVLMMRSTDPGRSEAALRALMTRAVDAPDGTTFEEQPFENVVFHVFDDQVGYCIDGDCFYIANYIPLLRGALKARAQLVPTRYATDALPEAQGDTLVAQVRIDRLAALFPRTSALTSRLFEEMPQVQQCSDRYLRDTAAAMAGDDPMLCVVSCSDRELSVRASLDGTKHSDFVAQLGEAKPLHLAARFPEETGFLAAFRISDSDQTTARQWFDALPSYAQQQSPLLLFRGAREFIDDEIALGASCGAPGWRFFALASVNNGKRMEEWFSGVAGSLGIELPSGSCHFFRKGLGQGIALCVAFTEEACAVVYGDTEDGSQTARLIAPTVVSPPPLLNGIDQATPMYSVIALDGTLAEAAAPSLVQIGVFGDVTRPAALLAHGVNRILYTKSLRASRLETVVLVQMK